MKKLLFQGVATALATPFINNQINIQELEKFIKYQIDSGIDALVVCGTTGESSTMSESERISAINCVVKTVKKKIPVIVGTGSNNTQKCLEMSKTAENLGADALLVVTPYYNKTTQKGIIEHFKLIASSVSIPIILYNVPSRTGINILPETCFELSKINNIVGIKEASGNISQIAEIANLCGDNLYIYSGSDDQILPTLSLGGKGVVSVLSNIAPKLTCNITNSFFKNEINISCDYQLKCIPLIKTLFAEINPIPVKQALNLLGFNFGSPRLPLVTASDNTTQQLIQIIKNLNLLSSTN